MRSAWVALALVAACGGASSSSSPSRETARPEPRLDPAAERAEVQAALDEDVAAATAPYGKFIVEAKFVDNVHPGAGSTVLVDCSVTVTLSQRESGKMIGFSKTSAAVDATEATALLARKDCVVGAARGGLEHFQGHFATSVSAFALAAAQSGIRSGALAFN